MVDGATLILKYRGYRRSPKGPWCVCEEQNLSGHHCCGNNVHNTAAITKG